MANQNQPNAKSKNNFLKFLPKAASSVYFHNPPFSPSRDHRIKPHSAAGKGFSGPIISIIPDEARRRTKNGGASSLQEPTSPKISCIGQIKHKKKKTIKSNSKKIEPETALSPEIKKPSVVKRLLTGGRRRSVASVYDKQPLSDRAPPLSQLKRFASGRETLADFDWSSPEGEDRRSWDSDEEEIVIPFSAPIIVGSAVDLRPRKEVNLWRRRTVERPEPLQLNLTVRTVR